MRMIFCINCGATPYYKKKGKKFCSIECEKEYFQDQKLIKQLKKDSEIKDIVNKL